MGLRVLITPGNVFHESTIIITDGKRWCEHSLEMFSERPEYWWAEAHRALRDDPSIPFKGE